MEMSKKEMLAQKITAAVTEDQEFYKAFISAQDAATLQKVLSDHGFDFSVDEINDLFRSGAAEIVKQNSGNELSEEDLDDVAGGGFLKGTMRLIVSCGVAYGYGALCGVCPAAYAGAKYVAGGLTAWTAAGYMK